MKLLVIRHAIAMDRDEFADTGEPDDRRPLTNYGAKRMRKNAKGLRTIIDKIDRFGTSPLTRAIETAEIVSEVFSIDQAELCAALVPGIAVEEFEEMGLESPFDLMGLYRGVSLGDKSVTHMPTDVDHIFLYRRPLLDYWCETGEDLTRLVRHLMVHEIGHHFGFSDEDMERLEESAG